jgi:hypothetical protein
MKWLIILALIVAVFALIAFRYRKQIQAGLQIWRMFRQIRKASGAGNNPAEKRKQSTPIDKSAPLVKCARCGKWITETSALNLRSKTFYCSTNCMEKAARIESLVDRN